MVQKTISATESKLLIAEQEALRKRAARQASRDLENAVETPDVQIVVLPQGDGKISMGQHAAGIGEVHYEEGEKPTLKLPIAVSLYDRGYVNFEGAKEASEDAKKVRQEAVKQARQAAQRARDEAEGL